MEINQCDIKTATTYYVTMVNDIAKEIHCDVTMSDVYIGCYVYISWHHNA